MSAKLKPRSGQQPKINSKLTAMANAVGASDSPGARNVNNAVVTGASSSSIASPEKGNGEQLSMATLISELAKQRASLKDDMKSLIQESITPLQTSMDALRETVGSFQNRLDRVEVTAGDNFQSITQAETTIRELKAENTLLLDRVESMENFSRRANLRIINVPTGSETGQDPVTFMSNLLFESMGPEVFDKGPPELERAHRTLAPRDPAKANKQAKGPRAFVVCFHRFQEKERALRWARSNELRYKNKVLRVYQDYSVALSTQRAAYNDIKGKLYRKDGVRFGLLHPARLRVTLPNNESFIFDTPEKATAFYNERFPDPE